VCAFCKELLEFDGTTPDIAYKPAVTFECQTKVFSKPVETFWIRHKGNVFHLFRLRILSSVLHACSLMIQEINTYLLLFASDFSYN
jgi:hypothetical protein